MTVWYWRRNPSEKVGPRSAEEVRAALVAGLLEPGHEVWREGWDAWARIADVEEFRGVTAPARPAAAPPPGMAVPDGLRGWMSFVGVMNVLLGLFLLVTCVGVIRGILALVAGFAVLGARTALDAASGRIDPALLPFLGKLKTFFIAQGLAYALVLVLLVGGLIALWSLGMLGTLAAALGH